MQRQQPSGQPSRERAVGDGYGIERMGSDRGILLGIILNFCHFLSVLKGLTIFLLMLKVELSVPRLIFDDSVLHSQSRLE